MSIAAAQTNEEDEPSSLYDNPDIEFLLPNIPIPELAFCLANEEEPIAKRMRVRKFFCVLLFLQCVSTECVFAETIWKAV